ncbi:hypothetical protein HD553DRAFT_19116 [Filobasidium floriforme]|uniref:uncharacterized protein n=1 Tax=Filobasidium floriforme TaxID=5210 RepID=UPI001E8DF961|nr:uncharacterized protein HD553DRAFT_19116 [Filobasidium floriforme]KAH8090868.1 hypothetical protein HD553DRAFT_19116 [Filobasidium floriforme]
MSNNASIIHKGACAVVTGAASGIGLAASKHFASAGMHVVMVDINTKLLETSAQEVKSITGAGDVSPITTDVSKFDEVIKLKEKVLDLHGEIAILMNNAALLTKTAPAFSLTEPVANVHQTWEDIMSVNFGGVLNGTQIFAPVMAHQENPSVIINTGSKQGITCPPGNAAYNASKSAVKTLTEQLAHELRNLPDSKCSSHLFVPGWVHTGERGRTQPKPDGAWTPEETVAYMLDRLSRGDFYIICPDNDVTSDLDKLRIAWSLGDVVDNRPALSRWHNDYKAHFDDYIKNGLRERRADRSRSRGRLNTTDPSPLHDNV